MTMRVSWVNTHDRAWHSGRYRLAQAWAHLAAPDQPVVLSPHLATLLNDGILDAFRTLPAADQAHLVSVATQLVDVGWDDDVVTAGLLHDIGKAAPGARITVVDRGLWVILKRIWPSWAEALAGRETQPHIGSGLWALARHPESGAAMLAAAGYNYRVCWLVRHHERHDLDDPGLRALIAADDGCRPREMAAAP
jgi:hypothetical protein